MAKPTASASRDRKPVHAKRSAAGAAIYAQRKAERNLAAGKQLWKQDTSRWERLR